jgi:MtN3 and saliva related transmembrane protein
MHFSTTFVNGIGFFGAVCTTASFIPQLLRVIKLRSAREISYSMFVLFAGGSALWLTYGLLTHSVPIAVSNTITLLLSLGIFAVKLRFDRERTV